MSARIAKPQIRTADRSDMSGLAKFKDYRRQEKWVEQCKNDFEVLYASEKSFRMSNKMMTAWRVMEQGYLVLDALRIEVQSLSRR